MNTITITEVNCITGGVLKLHEPLVLEVVEEDGLFLAENKKLGISLHEYTLENLEAELPRQLDFLWDTYAIADDCTLAPKAIVRKLALLNAMRKVE